VRLTIPWQTFIASLTHLLSLLKGDYQTVSFSYFVYAYLFMQISTLLILNKNLCIKRRRKQNDIMTQLFIDHNQSLTVIKY